MFILYQHYHFKCKLLSVLTRGYKLNYYLFRIFNKFGVLELICDKEHNDGRLFSFKHGTDSKRDDAYDSRKNYSGYIKVAQGLKDKVKTLLSSYGFDELPTTQGDMLKSQWIEELYELAPIKYISLLRHGDNDIENTMKIIKNMLYLSKYGSDDGKDFEIALKESFDLFREVKECDIISGSGDTDIVCGVLNENETTPYKINVDAKKTVKRTQSLNAKRLTLHIEKNGSKYCIVVSPKFASGVKNDIADDKIVIIEAETLARYLSKDCLSSVDCYSNFTLIDKIIEQNYGKDITPIVNSKIDDSFSINIKE